MNNLFGEDVVEKYQNKLYNAKHSGVEFNLSIEEYKLLMDRAGISPDDIGCHKGQYVLARKCDVTGDVDGDLPYSITTCSFTTCSDNISEALDNRTFSVETRTKMSNARIGKSLSEETKSRMSISRTGKVYGPMSDSTKSKISKSKMGVKGEPCGEDTKRKISESLTGHVVSDATKQLQAASWAKANPEIECPHCGKIGRGVSMKRWHFDNCKVRLC